MDEQVDEDLREIRELQAERQEQEDLQEVRQNQELRALRQICRYRQLVPLRGRRCPNVYRVCRDAMRDMSDAEFKQYFRFDKATVAFLAGILDLGHPNNRGRPLTPEQQICIALNVYGGGIYSQIAGFCGGVSNNCTFENINRVTDRQFALKAQYIQLPTNMQMQETVQSVGQIWSP
jgi:hypothetical protein